ncbi:MAG: ATP-binding protein [Alphaproteobacteria bacterium]|nr:ATP-binding protein [Alphaproteobacteria bacterium]
MKTEKKILQVIAEQKEYIKELHIEKLVSRKEENLFEFDSSLAQVVIGVRRSGKSTICHKVLLEKNIEYAYVNFDDDRMSDVKTEDLNTVLSCIYQVYGSDIQYLFIDEIQNVDGWYLFVNRLLRTNIKVFVTGSNAKLLSGELATHLTGRYNEIRLYPFSFSEYCDFHKIDTQSITTKADAERKRAFVEYVNDGGFPEIQNLRNKRVYVQSLIEAIVTKDIQKRFKVRNVDTLRKITHHLINNICQEINYDEISKLLNITDNTVRKYVDYLRQAFLIQLLTKYSYKSKERIRNAKSYIIDPGLQNNRDNAFASENIGWRLENIVYIELLRRCSNNFLDIYYYKANSRSKEVDFVVCNQNKTVELIQVAYDIDNVKTYNREVSSLINASTQLHCDNLSLIAFTNTRDIELQGKTIHIISAIEWLLEN